MLNFAQGSLNPTLTNYAKAIRQDMKKNRLADFIAPLVTVPTGTGNYKKFSDLNAFTVPANAALPPSGEPIIVDFGIFSAAYNCIAQGLEARVTKQELDYIRLSGNDPLMIQQTKINEVIDQALLVHENDVYNAIATGAPASSTLVAGLGNWSSASVDPTAEIDQLIQAMTQNMGDMPNRIVLDIASYQKWRNNPNTIKRHAYGTTMEGVTSATLIGYTINPQLQIRVGTVVKSSAKVNAGESRKNAFMGAGKLYMFFGNDAPTTADKSAFKTFVTTSSNIEGVISYTSANTLYEGHIVYWSRDIQSPNATYGSVALTIT